MGKATDPCQVEGCERLVGANGSWSMCGMHAARVRRHGDPQARTRPERDAVCTVDGCQGGHVGLGFCEKHYQRFKKYGDPETTAYFKGAGNLTQSGYRQLYRPEHPNAQKRGYVMEHVAVMAEALGRPLYPHERVHHRNGQRADNRLQNLELWSVSHPSGQRVEDVLAWAQEFIAQYDASRDRSDCFTGQVLMTAQSSHKEN